MSDKVVCNGKTTKFCSHSKALPCKHYDPHDPEWEEAEHTFCTQWGKCTDDSGEKHSVKCVPVKGG